MTGPNSLSSRRTVGLGLLAVPVLTVAAPLSPADISPFAGIPGIRFEHYDVEGRTPQEIYASMHARAPRDADGAQGLGRTSWQMDVHWRESRRGSSCTVSEPVVRMSISVLLPRLRTSPVTPDGLAFWRASLRGLEIHEAGHARIAWDHRDDFKRAANHAKCKSIDTVARQTHARIAALQQAYDRETGHGRTQTPQTEP